MTEIIDGIALSEKILSGLKEEVSVLDEKPGLGIILVGNDPSSVLYTRKKDEACKRLGFYSEMHGLPEDSSEGKVIGLIHEMNLNEKIHGILVQLPLPRNLDEKKILMEISPEKDVDGLHPLSLGKLMEGDESFAPCTPKGIIKMLEESGIGIAGKSVVIVNRSHVVGKPLAMMLLNRDATVTVCHSKTKNLKNHLMEADIIITATGKHGTIKGNMIKKGAVVIDAGISKLDGKTVGDVDFTSVNGIAGWLSPVPGGVGPLTVAMLMENTLKTMKNTRND